MSFYLKRITAALERLAPQSLDVSALWQAKPAYFYHPERYLLPIDHVHAHPLRLLRDIDAQKERLWDNTQRFAQGQSANSALLWGARGVGKSALVKSVSVALHAQYPTLCLIEIPRTELHDLPDLLAALREVERRIIIFCDDLSFEPDDDAYKSLKSVLDGSLLDVTHNTIFYATSNRRHLMTREVTENEVSAALHRDEMREERLSLTDRFGLWLGFHRIDQNSYLAMIAAYAEHYGLRWSLTTEKDYAEALLWSRERGNRSGRVAWQYIVDLAGRQGKSVL